MGWKQWVELHSTLDNKNLRTGWILNLRISSSIATWGLTNIRAARRKCTKYLNKDPPSSASRMYES